MGEKSKYVAKGNFCAGPSVDCIVEYRKGQVINENEEMVDFLLENSLIVDKDADSAPAVEAPKATAPAPVAPPVASVKESMESTKAAKKAKAGKK